MRKKNSTRSAGNAGTLNQNQNQSTLFHKNNLINDRSNISISSGGADERDSHLQETVNSPTTSTIDRNRYLEGFEKLALFRND
jgi:hypothetical protein